MTLVDKLTEDMKTAMKAREEGKLRLSVIRLVRSAILNAKIEKQRELTDDDVIGLLAREVKLRRDANAMIPESEREPRREFISQNEQEIAILQEYLPQQVDEAAIRTLASAAIAATGASSVREMGKVMAVLAPQLKGKADGKLVNQIVKELMGN